MRLHVMAVATAGFGAAAVLAGAFGAHALADVLAPRPMQIWDTAVRFQFWHALALGLTVLLPAGKWRGRAAVCLGAGMLLFCASLYALALGAPRWVGFLTPLGGLLLVAGWLLLGMALVARPPARDALQGASESAVSGIASTAGSARRDRGHGPLPPGTSKPRT